MNDALELSLVEAAAAIRRGEMTSVELTESCIARAQARS